MNQTMKTLVAALLLSGSSHLLAFSGNGSANFLRNGDFDDGLTNWSFDDSSLATWIANYDAPPPGTHSIGAVALFQDGVSTRASQCVEVVSGEKYVASVWAIATCPTNARIEIQWNIRPDCADGSFIGDEGMFSEMSSYDWQTIQSTVIAPDTAQGALISLENEANCHDAVLFDGAFFGDRIFSNSFE
jgi:hypothetical protein